MSLAVESPLNSSSSDDFAALLDAELQSTSSSASLGQNVSDAETSEDNNRARIKRRKVSEVEGVEDLQASVSPRAVHEELDKVEASVEVKTCPHPAFIREMCTLCGQQIDDAPGVAFNYIHKGLKLGNEEIARVRRADLKNLQRRRKLYLVLDLDHTLLNSTPLSDVSSEEDYVIRQADSLCGDPSASLYKLDSMHMLTKLRPFVRNFLREASNMFEMYIYTMAQHSYAMEIAKLLDPQRVYFNSKVISETDCTQKRQKGLDVVLEGESATLIIDDTEHVWPKHRENLIVIERYHFFASSCRQFNLNGKSLSEAKRDESETEGALSAILKVLKRVHEKFFDPGLGDDLTGRDVRKVLKEVQAEILKGCKIVFSRVFPTNFPAENHELWKMAELLGATCTTELDPLVTHVVSRDAGTEKASWALRKNKFLVNERWIGAAYYLWKRQPEEQFSVPCRNQQSLPVSQHSQ